MPKNINSDYRPKLWRVRNYFNVFTPVRRTVPVETVMCLKSTSYKREERFCTCINICKWTPVANYRVLKQFSAVEITYLTKKWAIPSAEQSIIAETVFHGSRFSFIYSPHWNKQGVILSFLFYYYYKPGNCGL